MTSRWTVTMAVGLLVFAIAAIWLATELSENGSGLLLGPVVGLVVGAGLVVAGWWLRQRHNRGVFDARDLRRTMMPAAGSPPAPRDRPKEETDLDRAADERPAPAGPVTRGWDYAGDAAVPPAPSPRADELPGVEAGAPPAPPASPGGLPAEPMPDTSDSAPQPPARVLFSAYYPREIKPNDWQPLRAYMLKDWAEDAVRSDARAQFGARRDIRATSREALQPVPEEALVTAIPAISGFEFDPPQVSLRFRQDWRRFDFEFRATEAPLDASADGRITFLVEGVIVADVPLSVYVSETAGEAVLEPAAATAAPYPAIFCSYSHKDSAIVERVERASRYFNLRYLRDVTALRSGENWNARLLELIDSADIFQLFWSRHAAESEYVRQEYQYAAALRRRGVKSATFIRPIRWEEPMPAPPPPELAELHFDLIPELARTD